MKPKLKQEKLKQQKKKIVAKISKDKKLKKTVYNDKGTLYSKDNTATRLQKDLNLGLKKMVKLIMEDDNFRSKIDPLLASVIPNIHTQDIDAHLPVSVAMALMVSNETTGAEKLNTIKYIDDRIFGKITDNINLETNNTQTAPIFNIITKPYDKDDDK